MKKNIKKIINIWNDMDKPLFYVTVCFFIIGLLAIVSASSREAVVRYGATLYHYFFKQLGALTLGLLAFIFIIGIDSKKYKFWGPLAYSAVVIALVYVFFGGEEINGAKNWITLPGIGSLQPGEFAKPTIIIMLSLLFEKFYKVLKEPKEKKEHYKLFLLILGIVLLPIFFVFLGKDLGTVIILIGIFLILFLASPFLRLAKLKMIILMICLGVVGLLGIYFVKGYILTDAQLARFDFINPCSNYEKGGYQVCNGFIAINDGGLFGLGIGKSKQKYSYLSEPHTDSIFAIISEELGFLRCSILFLLYIIVLLRILSISAKANTIQGRYICLGVASYLFIHIFLNLGGLFGSIPLTGVPLPFLSYGGSSALATMISLALVQRVAVETKRKRISV